MGLEIACDHNDIKSVFKPVSQLPAILALVVLLTATAAVAQTLLLNMIGYGLAYRQVFHKVTAAVGDDVRIRIAVNSRRASGSGLSSWSWSWSCSSWS